MRFLYIILLVTFMAGSVPAMAEICCDDAIGHSDNHKEKSKSCESVCANCLHHSHASDTNAWGHDNTVRKSSELYGELSDITTSDFKYPLLEPPSHS